MMMMMMMMALMLLLVTMAMVLMLTLACSRAELDALQGGLQELQELVARQAASDVGCAGCDLSSHTRGLSRRAWAICTHSDLIIDREAVPRALLPTHSPGWLDGVASAWLVR
eukprot:COSAG01_NODE_31452_length_597_cov_1.399598_2_plen_112_part_00